GPSRQSLLNLSLTFHGGTTRTAARAMTASFLARFRHADLDAFLSDRRCQAEPSRQRQHAGCDAIQPVGNQAVAATLAFSAPSKKRAIPATLCPHVSDDPLVVPSTESRRPAILRWRFALGAE